MIAPWLAVFVDMTVRGSNGSGLSVPAALAAVSVAYVMAEGTGRLACISFGCCYGLPLDSLPGPWRRLLSPLTMTFYGKTKKIAYAHGLEGRPVIPVHAMTSVVFSVTGLVGIRLFLGGDFTAAFLMAVGVSQGWRFLSEFLRADYRGRGRISAYQLMALVGLAYGAAVAKGMPAAPVAKANLLAGLAAIWSPEVVIFLQALWIAVFVYTGRSRVTAAEIRLYVCKDRI